MDAPHGVYKYFTCNKCRFFAISRSAEERLNSLPASFGLNYTERNQNEPAGKFLSISLSSVSDGHNLGAEVIDRTNLPT